MQAHMSVHFLYLSLIPPTEADVWPVLAISILSLSGLSALLYARRSKEEPAIKARLFSRDLEYLCEGGSNLLCRAKPDAYILHFKKDASGLTHNDFDRQRRMQQFLCKVFPQLCISIPKILSIPASDIRTLDAHLLAARSKAVRKQRLDIGSDIRVQVGMTFSVLCCQSDSVQNAAQNMLGHV